MFENIEMMQTAQAMARHASRRQDLVARNVANADTPGYRALDMPDFADSLPPDAAPVALRATRPTHLSAPSLAGTVARAIDAGTQAAPNGNTVSLETEMVRAAELRQQHDMAMAIYVKARDILRASLGRTQ